MLFTHDIKPYQCPNCEKWWRPEIPLTSCLVFHQGSGCCHSGEVEVPAEEDIDFGGREIEHSDSYEED